MLPTPNRIFERFERGEMERDELQALMALHQRELIGEIEEERQHPAAALLERLLAGRAAGKLQKRYGGRLVREVLAALGDVEGFPAARWLWNAMHADVPLHCFLRMRREPVFRLLGWAGGGGGGVGGVVLGVAGGEGLVKRVFEMERDAGWRLRVRSER
jgi:hypothetical protein